MNNLLFTKSPQYSVSTEMNLVQTQIEGASLQVKAGNKAGVEVLILKVEDLTDTEGNIHSVKILKN